MIVRIRKVLTNVAANRVIEANKRRTKTPGWKHATMNRRKRIYSNRRRYRPPKADCPEENPHEAVVLQTTLNCHDILLGRGNGVARTKGNMHFRCVVWDHKKLYRQAPNTEKQAIAENVLNLIGSLDPPGRVLELLPRSTVLTGGNTKEDIEGQNGMFAVVSKARAIEKACQALRELKCSTPLGYEEYRKRKNHAVIDTHQESVAAPAKGADPSDLTCEESTHNNPQRTSLRSMTRSINRVSVCEENSSRYNQQESQTSSETTADVVLSQVPPSEEENNVRSVELPHQSRLVESRTVDIKIEELSDEECLARNKANHHFDLDEYFDEMVSSVLPPNLKPFSSGILYNNMDGRPLECWTSTNARRLHHQETPWPLCSLESIPDTFATHPGAPDAHCHLIEGPSCFSRTDLKKSSALIQDDGLLVEPPILQKNTSLSFIEVEPPSLHFTHSLSLHQLC